MAAVAKLGAQGQFKPGEEKQDTLSAKLSREAGLAFSAVPETMKGAVNRVAEIATTGEGAIDAATKMGSAYFLSMGIGMLTKSPGMASKVGELAPKAFGLLALFDVGYRMGGPMYDTWVDPARAAQAKADLGRNLGSGVVDYALMGAGANFGFKGAGAYDRDVPKWLEGPAAAKHPDRLPIGRPTVQSVEVTDSGVLKMAVNHDVVGRLAYGGAVEFLRKLPPHKSSV